MAPHSYPISLNHFPPDLIQAVAQDAAADAERVGQFLDLLDPRPTGEEGARIPLQLPEYFLLRLGMALRLLSWEQRGLHVHRDAGLPSAHDAIREVARGVAAPGPVALDEQVSRQLCCQVLAVSIERLAWNGRALLDAELELGDADEETLVEALADFLWAHRRVGEGPAPTE